MSCQSALLAVCQLAVGCAELCLRHTSATNRSGTVMEAHSALGTLCWHGESAVTDRQTEPMATISQCRTGRHGQVSWPQTSAFHAHLQSGQLEISGHTHKWMSHLHCLECLSMFLPENGNQLLCLVFLSLELILEQLSSLLSIFCMLPLSTQVSVKFLWAGSSSCQGKPSLVKFVPHSLKTLPRNTQASSIKERLFNLFQPLLWQTSRTALHEFVHANTGLLSAACNIKQYDNSGGEFNSKDGHNGMLWGAAP